MKSISGKKGSSQLSRVLDQKKGLGDFVRLSFTPRHPMMYVALDESRLTDPVILEINLSVVLIPGTLFSDRNAAANTASISDSVSGIRFDIALCSTQFCVPAADRPFFQAEILVPSNIAPTFIIFPETARTFLPPPALPTSPPLPPPPDPPHPCVSTKNATSLQPQIMNTPIIPPVDAEQSKREWSEVFLSRPPMFYVRPPPPVFKPIVSAMDPAPPLPERFPKRIFPEDPPLSCEYHQGSWLPCSLCVPGWFICPAHFNPCGAVPSAVCASCTRILCKIHVDCFCTPAEIARDEAKANRNRVIASNVPPLSLVSEKEKIKGGKDVANRVAAKSGGARAVPSDAPL